MFRMLAIIGLVQISWLTAHDLRAQASVYYLILDWIALTIVVMTCHVAWRKQKGSMR